MLYLLSQFLRSTSGIASTSGCAASNSQNLHSPSNKNTGSQSKQVGPPRDLGERHSAALRSWKINPWNTQPRHEAEPLEVLKVLKFCFESNLSVESVQENVL